LFLLPSFAGSSRVGHTPILDVESPSNGRGVSKTGASEELLDPEAKVRRLSTTADEAGAATPILILQSDIEVRLLGFPLVHSHKRPK